MASKIETDVSQKIAYKIFKKLLLLPFFLLKSLGHQKKMLIFLLFLLFMPKNSLASQFNGNKPECMASMDDNHEAVVETPFGFLEGLNYTVGTPLKPFHSKLVLGVAYAYNAIGEFRFRRPITVPSFSVASTKRYERHCFPNKNYPGVKDFNEDCLFLNIFMPNDESMPIPEDGFPVLFFIHGGMFNYGASDDLDLTSIVENYVRRGIAVVTVNYRLGPFGFFQSRARHFSYNIGLWDLEKAFEFVLVSAEKLHLDRTKITLGGVEGGAVLAELLSLRDEVRENISGLILVGGSTLSPWAISPGVFDASMKLAEELGINTTDPRDVVYGIKMAYASSLIEIREKTKELSQDSRDFIEFTPDFDHEFFYYSTLKKTFYEAREIDVLIITTRNEGSIRTSTWNQGYYGVFNEKTGIRLEKQSKYSCQNFEEFVQKHFNQSQATEILAEYKCPSSSITVTPFEIYKTFIGDFWFNIPAALSAMLYAELENNVFVAVVNTSDAGYEKFTGQKEMPSIIMNEAYLFSTTNPYNLDKTKAENDLYKATQNLLLDSVANFVKKDHTKLQKIDAFAYQNLNFGYLEIENGTAKIETKKSFNEKLPFWRNFLKKYGFNLLNPRIDDGRDLFYFEGF